VVVEFDGKPGSGDKPESGVAGDKPVHEVHLDAE
jgi:hypothetical protein